MPDDPTPLTDAYVEAFGGLDRRHQATAAPTAPLVERLRASVVPAVPIVGGYLGGEALAYMTAADALAAADEIERLSALVAEQSPEG